MDASKISIWLNIGLIILLVVGSIYLIILIKGKTVDNSSIYKKRNWYMTVIPVNTSCEDPKEIAKKIRSIDPKRGAYIVSLKTWCNSTNFYKEENCIICN